MACYSSSRVIAVKEHLRDIQWSEAYQLKVEKVGDGSLGIVVDTFKHAHSKETFTIITSVKSHCKVQNIALLDLTFRIIEVEGHKLTQLKFDDVVKVIGNCKDKQNVVNFRLQRPLNLTQLLEERAPPVEKHHGNTGQGKKVKDTKVRDDTRRGNKGEGNNQKSKNGIFRTILDKTRGKDKQERKPDRSVSDIGTGASCMPPVESPEANENIPLMAQITEHPDVIEEVLKNPWNIRWDDHTVKVTLSKTSENELLGFHYKIKSKNNEPEVFFLVDSITAHSPSDGKLLVGDYLRSVNSKAIQNLEDEEVLKTEVQRNSSVSLMIQRPGQVLNSESARRRSGSLSDTTVNRSSHDLTSLTSRESVTQSTPPTSQNNPSVYHSVNMDDIKIDGISVYNRMEPEELNITASSHPMMECEQSIRTIETFCGGTRISPPRVGLSRPDSVRPPPVEQLKENLYRKLEEILRTDLPQLPYIRINVISTSDEVSGASVCSKLLSSLHISEQTDRVLLGVKDDALSECEFSGCDIEDLLLAQDLAVWMRADIARGQNVDHKLSELRECLEESADTVHDIPLAFINRVFNIDQRHRFVELNLQSVCYDDLTSLWPSVYFTHNALYIIVFKPFSNNQCEQEINRVLTTINLIRSSSCQTAIYLVTEKPDSVKLEEAMQMLAPLESAIKSLVPHQNHSTCSCDRSKLPETMWSQTRKNSSTGHVYFFMNKDKDWSHLMSSLQKDVCSKDFMHHAYPKVALLAQKMLQKENRFTTQVEYFKDNILCKMLNCQSIDDVYLKKILTSMHHCGKILYHGQVAHRTTKNCTLENFICHRPGAVRQYYESILNHEYEQRERRLTARTKYSIHTLDKLAGCRELLSFLELYHIIEPADVHKHSIEYYLTPSYLKFLDQRAVAFPQDSASHCIKKLYVDFHHFLPINMCLSILCKVEEQVDDHVEIRDIFTAYYEHKATKFVVRLRPLQGFAEITISLKPAESGEVYSFLKQALSSAINTNLLTYHLGVLCQRDHRTPPTSPLHTPPATLTTAPYSNGVASSAVYSNGVATSAMECSVNCYGLHIIDMEHQRSPRHSFDEQVTFWNISNPEAPYKQIGPSTRISQVPDSLLNVICDPLNDRDGWKKLAETLCVNDQREIQRLSRQSNPCKTLITDYAGKDNGHGKEYSLEYLVNCVCVDMRGPQRKDIQHDIKQWLHSHGLTNWMLTNGWVKNGYLVSK